MEKNFTFSFLLVALIMTMSTTQATARFAYEMVAQLKNTIQQEITSNQELKNASMIMMPCSGANDEIGGVVFSDYDKDGLNNQIGVGIEGVEVFIFDCDANGNSNLISSTLTDANGDYSFTGLTEDTEYRLEFVAPDEYSAGFGGGDNGTNVQFVTAPSCAAHAAFAIPEDYCGTASMLPNMMVTCFVNGDPLATPSDVDTEETVVLFPYDAANSSPTPVKLAEGRETGGVYGLVYQRKQKRVFTSAFMKRHVGMGTLGLGGIYTIDVSDINNPVVTPFIDVATLGINVGTIPSNSARGLTGDAQDPSNDANAFDGVGKLGIGAMALSLDETTLWFMSLNDQTLYSLVIDSDNNFETAPTAADLTAFTLPDAACTNGTFRPFAVKIHRDQVYIGGVCDAAMTGTAADLEAIVYHKVGSSFNEVLRFDLDYEKGYANKDGDCELVSNWNPWRADIPPACTDNGIFRTWPTPMLTDLEFDVDGSLILGFTDRMGHQIGYKNYPLTGETPLLQMVSGGDLLRAYNNDGVFEIENNASAGLNTTMGVDNMQGPGGGEYYYRDVFEAANDVLVGDLQPHRETSQGALAFYVGTGDVVTTALDPYSTNFNIGGVNWMNNVDGAVRNPGYRVFTSQASDITNFQKANGLGDLVLACAEAPLEIGGRIWEDSNGNGVQDACETNIGGIAVTLYDDAGTALATVTTVDGAYYFNPNTPGLGALNTMTTYHIAVGTNGDFAGGLLQNQYVLTTPENGMSPNADLNDSDGTIASAGVAGGVIEGFPYVTVTTGEAGFVDHSVDMGFLLQTGIGGFVWDDDNINGLQDNGELGIEGVTVTLFDNNDNQIGTTTSDVDGLYSFENISMGSYYVIFDETTNTAGETTYQGSPQNQGDGTNDSDPDSNTGQTDLFSFDPANGFNNDIDAGFFISTGSIGGFVWDDENGDGIQDNDETSIQGVTVTLYASDGTFVQEVTTNENGIYVFDDIALGGYYVVFDETTNTNGTTGYQGSPQNQGDGTNDSDPDAITGQTNTFSFDPDDGDNNDIDAGYTVPGGTIGGFVWNDHNEDGIQDDTEGGIEGVTVTLFTSGGTEVGETMTNASGTYSFSDVPVGNYYVIFDETTNTNFVQDYEGSPQNQGDGTNDSDADAITGQTNTFEFDPADGSNNDIDAGFYAPVASISGYVWDDTNQDGIQDDDEEGIPGVRVNLFLSNGAFFTNTTTDENGLYSIDDLSIGDYYIVFDETTNTNGIGDYQGSPQDQGNGMNDSDANPSNGETNTIVFMPLNGDLTDVDAGFFQPNGTIIGFAWYDLDEDGIFDNNESGIEGVTITLVESDGVSVTTTDVSGMYMFPNVPSGDYVIIFDETTNTAGNNDYQGTLQNIGDDNFDSDADPNTGETDTFTFDADGINNNVNAGYTLPVVLGSIGDFAFLDFDKNGIQSEGEIGLVDVPVTLTGVSNDALLTTTTDANGHYIFENIVPGTYTLTFDFPPNFTELQHSPQNIGGDEAIDSDADENTGITDVFTLAADQAIDYVDAGYFDGKKPTFPNPYGDVTINCDDPEFNTPTPPEAIDDFDTDVTVTFEDVVNNNGGLCNGEFVIIRTWTATDDFGNTESFVQNLTVLDDEAPVLLGVPGDTMASCDDIPEVPEVKAVDNCDEDVDLVLEEVFGGEGCNRTLTRTWTATDDCGNTTSDSQVIFLVDNTPPVITFNHPDLTDLMDGDTFYVEWTSELPFNEDDVTATDECSDEAVVTMYDFVNQAGICIEDGFIWEMVCVWEATDPCGNTSELALTVYFVDTEAPVLTGVPEDITVDCGEVPENTAVVTAEDNCDEEVFVTYLETTIGDICEDYVVIRRWTAIDDCGNIVVEEQVITVEVDELKIVGVPDDLFINCDDDIPAPAEPILLGDCYNPVLIFDETILGDSCHDYKIIRQWTARNDCGIIVTEVQTIFVNVPELEFLEFPEAVNVDCDDIPEPVEPPLSQYCFNTVVEFQEDFLGDTCHDYKIVRKWTAMNDCGQMAMVSQTITVEVPDFEWDIPEDITINCEDPIPAPVMPDFSDLCYDVMVDLVEEETPGECEDEYKITRTYKATTSCGDVYVETQMITIVDEEAPVIICTNPIFDGLEDGDTLIVACGEIPLILPSDATATDNCDPNPDITFTEEITNSADCAFEGFLTKMRCGWIAIDRCGNVTKKEVCIIVTDQVPPVISGVPGDLTVNTANGESLPAIPSTVVVSDNCADSPFMSFSENVETTEGQCGYTILRTWSAADDCGNTAFSTQTIQVLDVCECPNIVIDDYIVKDASCNDDNGSIRVNTGGSPSIFDYTLIPDVGTSNDDGNERYDLPVGSYLLLIFLPNVEDCIEKIYFDINQGNCIDIVEVTIPDALTQICLDDDALDYEGTITSTSFCEVGSANTVLGTAINEECVTLQPATGYDGTETICVIHCFNGGTASCDTTYLEITVEPEVIECNLQTTASSNNPSCDVADGSIQLSTTGSVGDLTYSWSPNVSTASNASGLDGGTYTVTITDQATTCTTETTITLDTPQPATISPDDINVQHVLCANDGTGAISSNSDLVYTVWNQNGLGFGSTPIDELAAGDYTVIYTNADGCEASTIVTINQPAPFQFSISTTPESCTGNDGVISIGMNGGAGDFTYVWTPDVSNTGTATGVSAGVTYSVLVTDETGCSMTLTDLSVMQDCDDTCVVEAGTISTNDATTFCIEDGEEDFVNISVSGNSGNYLFVIVDENDIILTIFDDPVFNFEGEYEGDLYLIGLAMNGVLNNLSAEQNINDVEGCFDLSNRIFIQALDGNQCTDTCEAEAGTIFTTDPTEICADDGEDDIINISVTGNVGDYTYIVTNADSIILGVSSNPFFNLEGAGSGACLIWGVATQNTPITVEANDHIQEIVGCADLSNPITVERNTGVNCETPEPNCTIDAGTISTDDPTSVCVGDGEADIVTVSHDSNESNYIYIITNADSIILEMSVSPNLNFEEADAGLCLIWGLVYEASPVITPGDHIATIEGCTDLTEPIAIERLTGEDCDGNNPNNVAEICDNGIDDDGDGLVDCEDPDCCGFAACSNVFEMNTDTIGVIDCLGDVQVCLDVPFDLAMQYTIENNGTPYTGTLVGCNFDTTLAYGYFSIPAQGATGPYTLNSWTINGDTFSGEFLDLDALLDSMNTWDNTGTWMINEDALTITGGNAASDYSNLVITQNSDGATALLELNTNFVPLGSSLNLELGLHRLVFTHNISGCTDTMKLMIECRPDITTETINVTTAINTTDTICLDTAELPGNINFIDWACIDIDDCSNVDFSMEENCLIFTATDLGTDSVQIVVCDDLDYCDTTLVVVTVNTLMPIARMDADTVQQNESKILKVLENDTWFGDLAGVQIVTMPVVGALELNEDNTLDYKAPEGYCGVDVFTYELCNAAGCDTANVNILVECEGPVVYQGFSPNNDGVNDHFYISGMEQYPINELRIYDRWGAQVHTVENYKNDWSGTWNGGDLPDGVYFYLFTFGDNETMSGYVYLRR